MTANSPTQEQKSNVAYHYCGVGALKGIVESLTFRLTNVFFMNDHKEVKWLYDDVCRKAIGERLHKMHVTGDKGPSAAEEYLETLDHHIVRHLDFDHIYCGCFTSKCDDLSQWRGYAQDGRGVAIGFDLNEIRQENRSGDLRIQSIQYVESTQQEAAKKIIDEMAPPSNYAYDDPMQNPMLKAWLAYGYLSQLAPGCKNPAFSSEQETRLILQPSYNSNFNDKIESHKLFVSQFPGECKVAFDDRNGVLVPYAPVSIPATAVKEIIFGPKFGGNECEAAIRLLLAMNGVDLKAVKMSRSNASYR